MLAMIVPDGSKSSSPERLPCWKIQTRAPKLAVMLSRLYDDPAYMKRSVGHLKEHVESLAWNPERSGA